MTRQRSTVLNRYFIRSTDDGSYRTGQVRGELSEDLFLVEFDPPPECRAKGIKMPLQVVTLLEMAVPLDCGCCHAWEFFDSRAHRDAWLGFVSSQDGGERRVVSLVDHKKRGDPASE